MEIKIGIQETPRELIVSSTQSPEEVDKLVSAALGTADGILRLSDDKGRQFLVPANRIAYVEIAPSDVRKVGFAVGS
ncbi:MAG: DUF3107 domain-containing protein [Pseudonocardiaceae bacterium]